MSAVRIAVLGNSFANAVQLPALKWANENGAPNEVVVIAGRNLEKAQATAANWNIPVATDRWEDAFDSPLPGGAVDLAIVSTPVNLHAPMVEAAIRGDVAILCEKPFSLDGQEARVLRDAARGRLALIDHQTRWSPLRREMKRRIAAGDAGEPWSARVLMSFASERRLRMPYTWWYDEARGGGTLGALGSHMLDGIMDQFGTRVESVMAELNTYVKERPGPDGQPVKVTADEAFTLACRMHDGLRVQVESNIMGFGAKHDAGSGVLIEYIGSKGTLRLEGETRLTWAEHGGETEVIGEDALPSQEELGMPAGSGFFPRVLPSYLADVIKAAAGGRTDLPGAATFDDAVHVMDVLDAARESSREGRRVTVRSDA